LNSLDFVLLFVPIEPVFTLAVASDKDLFMDAWNRNVLPWSEAKSSIPRDDKALLLPGGIGPAIAGGLARA
jgi:RmuC family